jgi:hypothetical protein
MRPSASSFLKRFHEAEKIWSTAQTDFSNTIGHDLTSHRHGGATASSGLQLIRRDVLIADTWELC